MRLRVSQDSPNQVFGPTLTMYAEDEHIALWRGIDPDEMPWDHMSSDQLMELLCRISPDVTHGRHTYLRMMNPGHECKCYAPGGDTLDERATKMVEDFLNVTLKDRHGTPDILINKLATHQFTRGGCSAELVLDRDRRTPLDLAVVDPATIQFRKIPDAALGARWIPVQWQPGKAEPVSLDIPTFRYIGVDPLGESPKGRPIAESVLWTQVFLLGMLYDIKRVVQQQGWPRIDLKISLEQLANIMPTMASDTEKAEWLDKVVEQVRSVYRQLKPDDAYVHTDVIEVGRPVGAVESDSLGAVGDIITTLERMTIRALKSLPLMFGVPETVSEARANREWEVYVAAIKAMQHANEALLEHLLTVMLRAQGIQARVEFRFAELRAAELMRDAQTEAINLDNAIRGYDQGLLSQDEAAQKAFGKDKADQPAPRAGAAVAAEQAAQAAEAAMDVQPEPGSNRMVDETLVREIVALVMARQQQQQPGRNGKEEVAA